MKKQLFDLYDDIRIFPLYFASERHAGMQKGSSFADGLVEPPRGDESEYKFKNKPPQITVWKIIDGSHLAERFDDQCALVAVCDRILALVCGQYDLFIVDKISQ